MKRIFFMLMVLGCLGRAAAQVRPTADSVERLRQETIRASFLVDSLRTEAKRYFEGPRLLVQDSLNRMQDAPGADTAKVAALRRRWMAGERHFSVILLKLDTCTGRLNILSNKLEAAMNARKKE